GQHDRRRAPRRLGVGDPRHQPRRGRLGEYVLVAAQQHLRDAHSPSSPPDTSSGSSPAAPLAGPVRAASAVADTGSRATPPGLDPPARSLANRTAASWYTSSGSRRRSSSASSS